MLIREVMKKKKNVMCVKYLEKRLKATVENKIRGHFSQLTLKRTM